ncbi:MAG: DUF5343 domain-containing protein [Candidatus Sabulitectum sp.]|nr:DUF5343 domain-containing protein [Candidatus Sabulitectum sp.]
MKTYPAVRDPGSIELLFHSIRSKDQPDKITTDYLASMGFRRQPDVKLLELLYFLGFIDNNFSPTHNWQAVKGVTDEQFRIVLTSAMAQAYAKLFEKYSPEETTNGKILMGFFKDETGVSDTESAYMVLTLNVLSDLADFKRTDPLPLTEPAIPAPASSEIKRSPESSLPDVPDEPAPGSGFANGVSMNINIPAEAMDEELTAIVKELLKKYLKQS